MPSTQVVSFLITPPLNPLYLKKEKKKKKTEVHDYKQTLKEKLTSAKLFSRILFETWHKNE